MKKDMLELETRKKIFDLISKNPGLHLSKIASLLKMRGSLVEYHLFYLEKNNVIKGTRSSGYTRYYVTGRVSHRDKKIISMLRKEVPLKVVLFLLKKDIAQHKDILENIDVAASTLSYHIKNLIDHGLISVNRYGRDKGYVLENREAILTIILQYKPYNLFDGFEDIWKDLTV